jgi:Protein of unknown function (DUF2975)
MPVVAIQQMNPNRTARAFPSALWTARALVRTLVVLNLVLGVGILALLVASLVARDAVFAALGVHVTNATLILGMRLIMVIGIGSVPLAHILLTRLLAIVDTVRRGDPFVAGNAARLQTTAWALLGLELLHLAVGAIAAAASTPSQPLDLDWNFSIAGWLAVLLLFVLARVFDYGTRMRDDLEGTV